MYVWVFTVCSAHPCVQSLSVRVLSFCEQSLRSQIWRMGSINDSPLLGEAVVILLFCNRRKRHCVPLCPVVFSFLRPSIRWRIQHAMPKAHLNSWDSRDSWVNRQFKSNRQLLWGFNVVHDSVTSIFRPFN